MATFRFRHFESTVNFSESTSARYFRSRRSHKKSRLGCLQCKKRRTKCDETRPACLACERRNAACSFPSMEAQVSSVPEAHRTRNQFMSILPADLARPSLATLQATMINDCLFNPVDCDQGNIGPFYRFTTNDLMGLQHFEQCTGATIGNLDVRKVYSTVVPRLAVEHLHLMHAVLAMARLHKDYLAGRSVARSGYARYHWQQCLSLFAENLSSKFEGESADAMLITSTLINGLAFVMVDSTDTVNCWPLSSGNHDLQWLSVQPGINLIFQTTFPLHDSSKIKHIFGDMSDSYAMPEVQPIALMTHASKLCELCGITENSNSSNNTYLEALQLVVPLMHIPCVSETIFAHLSFLGNISAKFISLLRKKDHIALLILSYWYAQICTCEAWWIALRSNLECAAICDYLQQNAKDEIVELLGLPAKACGFNLHRHSPRSLSRISIQPQTLIPCEMM